MVACSGCGKLPRRVPMHINVLMLCIIPTVAGISRFDRGPMGPCEGADPPRTSEPRRPCEGTGIGPIQRSGRDAAPGTTKCLARIAKNGGVGCHNKFEP
jgi:hypothetical protein